MRGLLCVQLRCASASVRVAGGGTGRDAVAGAVSCFLVSLFRTVRLHRTFYRCLSLVRPLFLGLPFPALCFIVLVANCFSVCRCRLCTRGESEPEMRVSPVELHIYAYARCFFQTPFMHSFAWLPPFKIPPQCRGAALEEVAGVATFLASPLSSAVTGQTVFADCGFSAVV